MKKEQESQLLFNKEKQEQKDREDAKNKVVTVPVKSSDSEKFSQSDKKEKVKNFLLFFHIYFLSHFFF